MKINQMKIGPAHHNAKSAVELIDRLLDVLAWLNKPTERENLIVALDEIPMLTKSDANRVIGKITEILQDKAESIAEILKKGYNIDLYYSEEETTE